MVELYWMNLIRKRLEEKNAKGKKYCKDRAVIDFITPIWEKGLLEEERISQEFRDKNDKGSI